MTLVSEHAVCMCVCVYVWRARRSSFYVSAQSQEQIRGTELSLLDAGHGGLP